MRSPAGDRRRHARQAPDGLVGDRSARLRSGPDLTVMDVSGGGVLFETASRVLPGSRVEVVLPLGDGCRVAMGQVVRAWVARIDREEGVWYRAAIAFDREVTWMRENLG